MSQNSTGALFLLLTSIHSSAAVDASVVTLTIDTCHVEAGVVEYPVIIQNPTVTLNHDKLKSLTVLSTYVCPPQLHQTYLPVQSKGSTSCNYLSTYTTVFEKPTYSMKARYVLSS
jgi:hypothetical protein